MILFKDLLHETDIKIINKVKKLVDQLNVLISKAVDSDGDKFGVVDTTSTIEIEEIYEPVEFNGKTLRFKYRELFNNKLQTDTIKKRTFRV